MSKAGPEAEIRSPLSRKFLARRVGQCKLGQSLQTRFYMAVNSPRNSNDIITPAVNLFSHHSSSNSIPDFFLSEGYRRSCHDEPRRLSLRPLAGVGERTKRRTKTTRTCKIRTLPTRFSKHAAPPASHEFNKGSYRLHS